MGFIVAIEPDAKTVKDIVQNWDGLAKSLNHKILTFDNLASFQDEFKKTENAAQIITLLMLPAETLTANPIEFINELKTTYGCEILISLFDNPKYGKNIDKWPVQNFLFKPFDLTILKEHTRFALLKNQKVQTEFVHTTMAKAEIESLRKFKIIQLTEFGFKINKASPLNLGEVYKFYHPLFMNQKQQNVWARVISTQDNSFELLFCQINSVVLAQVRKRILAAGTRVRGAVWPGRVTSPNTLLAIHLNFNEQGQTAILTDLISRNFSNVLFIDKKYLKPVGNAKVDLVISDTEYTKSEVESHFGLGVTYIQIVTKPLPRAELEARFSLETIRIEKPLDKAILVKLIKQLFPQMAETDPSPLITINFEEQILQSSMMELDEYSEAAFGFKQSVPLPLDTVLDIALSQDDETLMKEMKAKVHYVDDSPKSSGAYYHQLILFGMKDEFLKLIRLWTLRKHIQTNQAP